MKKYILFTFIICFLGYTQSWSQIGFCPGNTGEAIFEEDFGQGITNGPPLDASVTTYQYVGQGPEDGQYTISSNLMQLGSFHNIPDNTGNPNGKALIVNASFSTGLFYQIPVNGLCENNSYEFSAFLVNLYNVNIQVCPGTGIPVNVTFQIWDETDTALLAQGDTGNIPGTSNPFWQPYGVTFETLPGQTSVILKMINNGDGGCGNDLAIDDIAFRSCGDLTEIFDGESDVSLTICEDETLESLSLTANPDFSVYDTHFYQWQQSTDNVNWDNIDGETSASIELSEIDSAQFYRVLVAEDLINVNNTLCNSISNVFEVIQQDFIPAESLGDVSICEDEIGILTVLENSDISVNWYDAPTGGNLLQEDSFTFETQNLGTYYAESTSINNSCTDPDRIPVVLSLSPAPENEPESFSICVGEDITLDATLADVTYLWSTGETTSEITVNEAGIYTVERTFIGGCSSVKTFEIDALELIPAESLGDVEICEGEVGTLAVQDNPEINVDWFDAPTGGNLLLANSFTFETQNTATYYAQSTNLSNNCVDPNRTPVVLSLGETPENESETLFICPEESITIDASLTDTTYLWSTGETTAQIDIDTAGIYSVERSIIDGCTSIKEYEVILQETIPAISLGDVEICEGEDPTLSVENNPDIRVDWYDAPTNGNLLLSDSFTFLPETEGTYYAQSETITANCEAENRTPINLIINPTPENETEVFEICEGDVVILDASFSEVTYLWSTGETTAEIEVEDAGSYTVERTTTEGCSSTKVFEVSIIEAAVVQNIRSLNTSIIIELATNGDFLFSLDGDTYQDSPIFENVPGGRYSIRIDDNCNIQVIEFIHLVIPQFFTPNEDGFNDVFRIPADLFFDEFSITIFDRYGKLILAAEEAPFIWDGTYNGKALPSQDFWYKLNVNGTIYTGHVTLKR